MNQRQQWMILKPCAVTDDDMDRIVSEEIFLPLFQL